MSKFLLRSMLLLIALSSVMMAQRPRRVVFFGDSITEAGVGPEGYITQIGALLRAKGKADQFELIGAGISGNKVYDLYLRLEKDVLARNPDVVVIFVGVNDVYHKRLWGTGTDADKFLTFYEAIIAKLLERKIQIILATPASVGEKTDCSNDMDGELNHYAQMIRECARTHELALVDLRMEFLEYDREHNPQNKEKGILTTDGIHFSAQGNALAASKFCEILLSH